MSDLDPKGIAAARAYAQWHLGYSSWADQILGAYSNPETTLAVLKEEKESYE